MSNNTENTAALGAAERGVLKRRKGSAGEGVDGERAREKRRGAAVPLLFLHKNGGGGRFTFEKRGLIINVNNTLQRERQVMTPWQADRPARHRTAPNSSR